MSQTKEILIHDRWQSLRQLTDARIALGHAGSSLPTSALLNFQLCHAQARDAVLQPLDYQSLQQQLEALHSPVFILHSQAQDRRQYLQRPDLGRRLDSHSQQQLRDYLAGADQGADLAIVISEGLSSAAISHHAQPFLDLLLPQIQQLQLTLAPLTIVQQGRVAVGDDVCFTLKSKMVVMLIGERPGLSSPDSMGIYFTYNAYPGITDEKRNCLSNVRLAGMSYQQACHRLSYLIQGALKLGETGVQLKDESEASDPKGSNFLLPTQSAQ
ncbi:ethanolamine ammonia-lyase subunit EutC [Celerinatantimonas sp. YJH-8]|uniref:ethanolamine ammonia-lyase subunit EutC n=1 Tax=Celerinatantimonas sp. YJH-8 TaxID=3228714 RepID=UPI0038BF64FF